MRKSFVILLLGFFIVTGCSDELAHRLDRLEDRIERLEKLCERINNNIFSLQKLVKAIEDGNFVTSVEPLEKDGQVIGYVIKFSRGDSITIYSGKDGEDGKDGLDAVAPVITAERYSDGIYYWKLNGKWLLDSNGNKVRVDAEDGKDGENGAVGNPGKPGADGQDGNVPQLKIEEGIWYVSLDNGASWQPVGDADGENGADGAGGDEMFVSVDTSNPDYVVFYMADGSSIKVPTWEAFEKLQNQCTEINSNLEALNTVVSALQNENYILSIQPFSEEGREAGYEIEFSKTGKIRIYNGKDAASSTAPVIGIRKDADGVYYWTMDGEWMLDSEGLKMRAEGYAGEAGQPGQPGQDAAVPQLKIMDNKWYICYHGDDQWQELGSAIGEDGPAGNPMDPLFREVTYDQENVYFTLQDGTKVIVPFAVESIVGRISSIIALSSQADGRVPMKKTAADKGIAVFNFMIYPESIAVEIAADWQNLVKMKAFYTLTRASRFIDLPVISVIAGEGGLLTVTASGENLDEGFYKGEKGAGAMLFLNDTEVEKNSNEVQIYPEF